MFQMGIANRKKVGDNSKSGMLSNQGVWLTERIYLQTFIGRTQLYEFKSIARMVNVLCSTLKWASKK